MTSRSRTLKTVRTGLLALLLAVPLGAMPAAIADDDAQHPAPKTIVILPTPTPTPEPAPPAPSEPAPAPPAPSEPAPAPGESPPPAQTPPADTPPPAAPIQAPVPGPVEYVPAPAVVAPAVEAPMSEAVAESAADTESGTEATPTQSSTPTVRPEPAQAADNTAGKSAPVVQSDVRAAMAVATGSPMAVQAATVLFLLALGFAYFRFLGTRKIGRSPNAGKS